jgi:hypothetical protein
VNRRTLFQVVAAAVSGLFVSKNVGGTRGRDATLTLGNNLASDDLGNPLGVKVFVVDEVRTCEGGIYLGEDGALHPWPPEGSPERGSVTTCQV